LFRNLGLSFRLILYISLFSSLAFGVESRTEAMKEDEIIEPSAVEEKIESTQKNETSKTPVKKPKASVSPSKPQEKKNQKTSLENKKKKAKEKKAAEEKKKKEEVVEPLPATMEQKLIKRNIEISEWFDGIAESIDLFLVGKKVTRAPNETRVVIEDTTYSLEHTKIRNHVSIGVFPRFPNLEKYWALKFTSYDEKEDRRDVKNNYVSRNPRVRNYGATVAWYRKFGAVRTSFEPRIELQDPLRISHSLTFDSVANLGTYELHPKLELYASARRGPGVFEAFDIAYFIDKKWTLTLINEGDYLDKTHLYTVNNGFSLANTLTRKSTLSYGLIFTSLNKPNYHLDSYVTSVSYNEMIYKKIFDYTLTPYVQFTRSKGFKGEIGCVLNLRLQF
jgi:hypothetical protein